jgi:hypothetical protein
MAEEQEATDPAGRQVDDDFVVHAYDAEAHKTAHAVIRRKYTVRAEIPWSGLAPRPRCAECVELMLRDEGLPSRSSD